MSSTTFTSGTVIASTWLNDVNTVTYTTVPALKATSTVATLPTASSANLASRTFVTDATTTTFGTVVVGSGSNFVPVYCDGTNWRIG